MKFGVLSPIEYKAPAGGSIAPSNSVAAPTFPVDPASHYNANMWAWIAAMGAARAHAHRAPVEPTSTEEQLAELRILGNDWDGQGSLAPTESIIDVARRVIRGLQGTLPKPDITPNDNGTITIEWRSTDEYASFEVGARTFAFMVQYDGNKCRFYNGDLDNLNESLAAEVEDALHWRRPMPLTDGQGWSINKVAYY